jgi:hypothetical protein
LSSQKGTQKGDLQFLFWEISKYWKSFDYVCGWFWKAANYIQTTRAAAAFVATNSVCQGQQVPMFWPLILRDGASIAFAHTSFKWRNLAAHNAGVIVVVVGISISPKGDRILISETGDGRIVATRTAEINAYLVAGPNTYVEPQPQSPPDRPTMYWGNKPTDGGFLILDAGEARSLSKLEPRTAEFIKPYYGSTEFIRGNPRACIWVSDHEADKASALEFLRDRFEKVRVFRASSKAQETRPAAASPHRFRQVQGNPGTRSIVIPIHSSESREHLPVGLLAEGAIISNAAYALYEAEAWNLALIASRLHLVWIGTVCGKLKTDFRYSNTLGWNTFPIPTLTDQNKADLTRCAENILLAREVHFPATIADLYDPETMPANLREAHERNDETLERIYIGRRFRNDTERLEKLFELYTQMTAKQGAPKKPAKRKGKGEDA